MYCISILLLCWIFWWSILFYDIYKILSILHREIWSFKAGWFFLFWLKFSGIVQFWFSPRLRLILSNVSTTLTVLFLYNLKYYFYPIIVIFSYKFHTLNVIIIMRQYFLLLTHTFREVLESTTLNHSFLSQSIHLKTAVFYIMGLNQDTWISCLVFRILQEGLFPSPPHVLNISKENWDLWKVLDNSKKELRKIYQQNEH